MDISAEIAAIQAASQGSELRQPLVGALNKLNTGSLPAVTASDVGKILKVGANGWEVGEKSGYMPVPTDTKQITENGTYDVTDYASASVIIPQPSGTKQITENGTYDVTDFSSAVVNVSGGGGGSVNILSGGGEPTASVGNNGTIYLQLSKQITNISDFTLLYDSSSSVSFGNYGAKVATRLGITDESAHNALMLNGWNANGAAGYDSENRIGAYAGYDFNEEKSIDKIKLWIGKYSAQNKNLTITVQTKDNEGTWHDIKDLVISTDLPYPLNVFDVIINDDIYGVRWIHNKTPNKSSNNNIVFFGMTLYEASDEGGMISNAFLKVNNSWQNLIGSDINDVNTGN